MNAERAYTLTLLVTDDPDQAEDAFNREILKESKAKNGSS